MNKRADDGKDVDVLPPSPSIGSAQIYAEIAAQINQYTDRPDLFLEVIEKHDPGFIKQMNEAAREHAGKMRHQRFLFGKIQSYLALMLAVAAALLVCGALYFLIYLGKADFWAIIALSVFYAITQGGSRGFGSIVSSFGALLESFRSKPDKK